ncbi:MAG TPA: RNA polymerase sigma factor SigZ [Nitrospiraceae bacterium]|nr:RNA polymerase sigma factor SigZ [Nitrospiraceae bacterium]
MEAHVQEMWQDIHAGLRAFIAKRVASEDEADDVVQDVWLKMQRGFDGLKDQSRLISWIYQIARHAIIDHYRAPGRRREMPAGLAADLEAHQSLSSRVAASEDSSQLRTELAGCLRPMIEQLSEDYRQAVTLVDLEGLTQQAAAVQLGLSLSGMKSRVQRGRRQLKRMLEACCTIELDRRRGVTVYDVRDQKCNSC